MSDVAKLLEALATVAWPIIVILLIVSFRPAVGALIESAKSRKFTLKLGGQELTMEEANQQQRNLIADLQAQVLEIHKRLEGSAPAPSSGVADLSRLNAPVSVKSVLWVDDEPKNNSYFVQQLIEKGITVDLALSTADGERSFDKHAYGAIVSDMGRTEDGTYYATAGLELLQRIRKRNPAVPFVIYCSAQGAREYKDEALRLGATAITSSPTEMFGILQKTVGTA